MRIGVIAGLIAVVVIGLGAIWQTNPEWLGLSPDQGMESGDQDAMDGQSPDGMDALRPSFDIARVGPDGTMVIAGRAVEKSQVAILMNDLPFGEVTATPRGEWTFVKDGPLAPGAKELTLVATLPDGREVKSNTSLIITVPEGDGQALAVLVRSDRKGASKILQGAEGDQVLALRVDSIDYDSDGNVIFAGRADKDRFVNLYLDDRLIGQVNSGLSGRWELQPEDPIEPGKYRLRADQVDAKGKVEARISLPFERAELSQIKFMNGRVIVQPGNSLWRIARRAYGEGVAFTLIYEANVDQIENPDLIYPGQIFSVPGYVPDP